MAHSGLPLAQRLTVSPREAAALLGVSEGLIRAQILEGVLPCTRFGRRLLIPRSAIEAIGRGAQAVKEEPARPIGRRTG